MKKKFVNLALVAAAVVAALPVAALARDHDGGHGNYRGWHGDIRHFEYRDADRWHGGGWRHGNHGGRLGWWWVVGGLWYFYPQPVYPYPDPYRPSVVVVQQEPAPVVVQVQQPPQPPAPSAPPVVVQAPTQYWYYCNAAKGYYPYVPACPSGWSKVPATPPGVTP
jgi:hypothetical protein